MIAAPTNNYFSIQSFYIRCLAGQIQGEFKPMFSAVATGPANEMPFLLRQNKTINLKTRLRQNNRF